MNQALQRAQPSLPHQFTLFRSITEGIKSPSYSLADDYAVVAGLKFTSAALGKELANRNLLREAPELDVPVYFFLGRHDSVLSAPLAEEYFRRLRAPRGKHLVWFEQSDHLLHLEEREKYRLQLRRVLQETSTPPQRIQER